MRRHIAVLIISFALLIAVVQFPQPAQAISITVDGNCTLIDAIIAANTDALSGNCPAGSGVDTIVLDVDVNLTNRFNQSPIIGNGYTGLPHITSDIILQAGAANSISRMGTSEFRLLAVRSGASLTINNLTLSDGDVGDPFSGQNFGGAIYAELNASLTVTDSQFINNQAWRGGAVYIDDNASLMATGSQFIRNQAGQGGAVYLDNDSTATFSITTFDQNQSVDPTNALGGAIKVNDATITIERSLLSSNTSYQSGGALSNQGGTVNISNSTLSGNSANQGGALYMAYGYGSINLNHTTVLNNRASTNGDALYMFNGAFRSTSSILASPAGSADCVIAGDPFLVEGSNNLTLLPEVTCSSITSGHINVGTQIDSVLANNGGPTLTHALFNVSDNPAIAGSPNCGLAIDQRGFPRDIICDIGSFEIQGPVPTSVPSPTPTQTAGNIVVDSNCTLIDAILAANYDLSVGTCPAGNGADTILLDVNTNLIGPYAGSTFIEGGRPGLPDILSDITIQGNLGDTISGNSSNFRIFNVTAGGKLTLTDVTITGGKISLSSIAGAGGGIYIDSNIPDGLTLNNVTMTNNVVESGWARGGAVFVRNTDLVISGSTFTNNAATNFTDGWGTGGALYLDDSDDLTVVNSLFESNLAIGGDAGAARGGAIAVESSGSQSFSNVIFRNNRALGGGGAGTGVGTASGGALFYDDYGHTLLANNVTFDSNIARAGVDSLAQGGAMWAEEMIISDFMNLTFTNNRAIGGDGTNGGRAEGGAVYAPSSYFWNTGMNNVTFSSNLAKGGDGTSSGGDSNGGAIYFEEVYILDVANISFTDNRAIAGNAPGGNGGDAAGGALGGLFHDLRFVDSAFDSNIARGGSGITGGDAIGGAIAWAMITFYDRDTFTNNKAIGGTGTTSDGIAQGGAVQLLLGVASITNSLIDSNRAISSHPQTGGGGLYLPAGVDPLVTDGLAGNTISNNWTSGTGGGVFMSGGVMSIRNNTFSGNLADEGGGAYFYLMDDVTIFNNTWSGNSANTGGGLYLRTEDGVTVQHNTLLNNTATTTADNFYFFSDYSLSVLDINGNIFATTGGTPDCYLDVEGTLTAENNLHSTGDSSCNLFGSGIIVPGTHIDTTLQNNGSPTNTHALLPVAGNPAIDGNPGCGLATDQRGFARDANCDIGAFEAGTLQNAPLVASATCNGPNFDVTIMSGDAPFNITASAGINTPVLGVGIGTTTIQGPEKWDDLTVIETSGDTQSMNLGQFKCRSDERPVPLVPAHRAHITDTTPTFAWAEISDANNYRVFVFDDADPATRTVDVRQNSGGPTFLTLNTPLPTMRLFWRARGRQNRIWSLWSIRFTLFVDPPAFGAGATPVPTLDLSTPVVVPTIAPTLPPDGGVPIPSPDAATPTVPLPPNSR